MVPPFTTKSVIHCPHEPEDPEKRLYKAYVERALSRYWRIALRRACDSRAIPVHVDIAMRAFTNPLYPEHVAHTGSRTTSRYLHPPNEELSCTDDVPSRAHRLRIHRAIDGVRRRHLHREVVRV